MLIVYHGAAGPELRGRFAAAAERAGVQIEVVDPETRPEAGVGPEAEADPIERWLAEMDVWWHVLTPITAEQIAACPN
ncbi:MAG: hypothetical protein GX868_02210, partial [Actinobacteria bacterium]|nr:hypothetical protein [Actinomycetota bacterium]